MASLTLQQRSEIIFLHENGLTISAISRELNISRFTVRFWIRRHGEEGQITDHRSNSGRRPILTAAQITDMVRHYEGHGFTPTSYFAVLYDVSPRTIRRALHSAGLHYRHHAIKVELQPHHKTARLHFARQYLDYDWSNVIFTDEKTFKSSQIGRLTLWRYNRTRYDEAHIVPQNQSGRITVNLWGWMSHDDVGELTPLECRATANNYVSLLEEVMLPTVRTVYPAAEFPQIDYVQDNAPIHTARVTTAWFNLHRDISPIQWPARSADMNPIENLWGIMIQRWDCLNERNPQALRSHCARVWDDIRGTDLCSRLVTSMRDRLRAVIAADGGYTRY